MKKLLILLCAIAAMSTAAYAQKPFLDTSRPEKFISFGVRAGLNSSGLDNNYLSAQPEMIQNNFYWRTGGQLGGSVDLYLRQFLAIQTGFFWENRGFDCSLMAADTNEDYMGSMFVNARFNYLHIPVMLSLKFNILPDVLSQLDFGMYYAIGVGGKKKQHSYIAFGDENSELIFDTANTETGYFDAGSKDFLAVKKSDLGLKIGTGLTFFKHYFIGVYYQRGLKNIAQQNFGSPRLEFHNSCWNVSLGYNF